MKPTDINEVSFDGVLIFGKYCLFSDIRIDRSTVPEGCYVYDIRHGDENDWTDPCEILPQVIVNYMGSIVTTERFPIEFSESFVTIDRDAGDWDLIENLDDSDLFDSYDNIPITLEEYIKYNNPTGWDIPLERIHQRLQHE